MTTWQIQEAKNKLSELINRALAEGPQVITRHGVKVAVVMPISSYKKLTTRSQRLGDFFINSPLRKSGIVIERDKQATFRDIEL